MASKFKLGDYVWAKMKGFPAWPARIQQPSSNVKIPADRKKKFVFFFHSENYSWMTDDQLFSYQDNKDKFADPSRIPKGFKEAVEKLEEAMQLEPPPVAEENLPSIDEELAIISTDATPAKAAKKTPASEKKKKSDISTPDDTLKQTSNVTPKQASAKKRLSSTLRTLSAAQAKKPRKSAAKPTSNHVGDESAGSDTDSKVKKLDYRQFLAEFPATDKPDKLRKEPRSTTDNSSAAAGVAGDYAFSSDELLPKDHIIATPAKIGFLGLGLMGSGMVTNLLRSGHEVTVWNRTPSKCKAFVNEGALRGNSPREVVEQCDITFSCVSDPAALKDLMFGDHGVLDGMAIDKGYVDFSTVDTDTVNDIAEAITAQGGRFLEAEVLGSRDEAMDGSLVILAAGDRGLYNDCYSCFSAMGRKSYFLGSYGAATKMKAVMNLLSGTIIAGLAESLALSEKMGLDTGEVLQVLERSPMHCPLIAKLARDMTESNYQEPHCKLQVMQKDLRLVVNMSDSVDQPLHVGAAVNEFFKKAKAKGYGEHDQAAIYRAADL